MTVRAEFVERFGEDAALRLEAAAEFHRNGINDGDRGTDPFKWALLIVIGYQCAELDSYRDSHGITEPTWDELREWIKAHGELASHDGDCDYVSLVAGAYNDYVQVEV